MSGLLRHGDWIETYSGTKFWPLDPRPDEISIVDIAHAISLVCRFTGHVREFYSVGEHSVRISHVLPRELALFGLLHDASEAYLCDVARPIKVLPTMEPYRQAERVLQAAIYAKFGLATEEPAPVKLADRRMLHTEKRDLMSAHLRWDTDVEAYPKRIRPWSPAMAEYAFLFRFAELAVVPLGPLVSRLHARFDRHTFKEIGNQYGRWRHYNEGEAL